MAVRGNVPGCLTGTLTTGYIIVKSYPALSDKPTINGVEIVGEIDPADLGLVTVEQLEAAIADAQSAAQEPAGTTETIEYTQRVASSEWVITHNMDKYPSVTIVDSGGNAVMGDVQYLSKQEIRVTFSAAFAGTAYLN